MRRTILLLSTMTLAMLLASAVGLLAPSERASATFAGQNGRIAFTGNLVTGGNPGGDYEIFTIKPDGSGLKQVTHNTDVQDFNPNFSPSGTKIAYDQIGLDGNSDIYVMNSNGSRNIRLTDDPAEDTDPHFAPDGKTIVFTSGRGQDGNYEIFRINADGSGTPTNLTNDPGQDQEPAVSPDGQIAFTSWRDDGDPLTDDRSEIYAMDADGSNQINRTNTPTFDEYFPNYSPDGQQITFGSNRDDNHEIYKMNSDGTGQTNLSNNPAANDLRSAFSPDGTKIVFMSDQPDTSTALEVYTMNADSGEEQTRLTFTELPLDIGQPDWQPR